MKTKKLAFLISGIIGSLTVAQVQAATDEAVNLDSIQVEGSSLFADKASATKTDTPIIDVPQSLSVVTAEQISLQGINSIGDIIDYTPGVNTSQGEGHRDSVVFRGVRSTADFFVDGVRDDVQYYRSLYNVEQVEVLRGPSALIFGRGVGGGAVNRVIKKAKLGEEFTTYQASLDSFSETSLQLDTNFIFNDNVAGRINFSYESLDNHRDFYEGDRIGINPTLKLKLSSATTVDLGYEYINHNRFIDRGIPTGADGEPVGSFDDIVFGDPDLNETDLIAHVFRADLAHVFSDNLTGNVKFSYGDYDKSYRNFYVSGYDQVNTPNVVTLDGYVDTTERQTLTLTGDLLGKFDFAGVQHKVLVGAEYSQTDSDQDRFNAFWNTTSDDNEIFTVGNRLSLNNGIGINSLGNVTINSFSDPNDDTRVELDVTSLYLQDEIAVTDWLDIVVGARYDRFDIEVNDILNGVKSSQTDNEVSPRAGIIFKPMENLSLYVSYSESFLPQSGEQYANLGDGLDPDVYENKEFGLKWNINPDLLFSAAYFEIEQETSQLDNSAEQFEEVALEVDGFELQLQGYITDQLSFNAGYTYLDGELADGNDPRELPENKFSLWTNYDYSTKLGFGVGVIYQDESFIDTDNTAVLPEYTRVDAAVYYHVSEKLRVQLNVENLFDEEYYPNAHATHQATVGAPINARLTVSGEF
jgi:catecholate siderophore receptor